MIIIAYNGDEFLSPLLESIEKHTPGLKIKPVSTDKYCIGSYLEGIEPDDEYMFMHDSMLVRDNKWLDRFREAYTGGIVAHSTFGLFYDSDYQRDYARSIIEDGTTGIFGPIFYCREAIEKLKPYFEKHPTDREQARGWERILGSICQHENIPISSVYGEYNQQALINDQLEGLTKLFPQRS